MSNYTHKCAAYRFLDAARTEIVRDPLDKGMWSGLAFQRKLCRLTGRGGAYVPDAARIEAANRAYLLAKELASSLTGKAELLIDREYGISDVVLRNLNELKFEEDADRIRVLTLLGMADNFSARSQPNGNLAIHLVFDGFLPPASSVPAE